MIFQRFVVFLLLIAVLATSSGAKTRGSVALRKAVIAELPASLQTLSGREFALYLADKASQGVLAKYVDQVFVSVTGSASKGVHYFDGLEALESFQSSTGKGAPLAKAYRQLLNSEQEMLKTDDEQLVDDKQIGELYQRIVKVLEEHGYDVPEKSYQELVSKITE